MTWLTTWPAVGGAPAYREHDTEAEAEADAERVVRAGAEHAVAFEIEESK